MKKLNLIIILALTQSCSWFESDYDELMNPIKDLKISEQRSGKSNPVFDGISEPNFPDLKENNKTLEGVDSNHDGVRDDIEIWINRMAEDQYVRIALKESYKKLLSSHMILMNEKASEQTKADENSGFLDYSMCLAITLFPYDKMYLKKHIEIHRKYIDNLNTLSFNTPSRVKLVGIANSYQYQSLGQEHNAGDLLVCHGKISASYLEKIMKEIQK